MDAEDFLRSLEGRELRTLTGAPNRIVGFDPGRVYVATDRSGPEGTSVPISWVQDALDELETAGEVFINVESVGYRSAFIGAVLREVPGARTSSDPLRVTLDGGGGSAAVVSERQRRDEMWQQLGAQGGPDEVAPGVLRQLGMYGGAQGVWVDKSRTGALGPNGVTVGLLHTGRHYADDLGEDGLLYHYPHTNRPRGRDAAEVAATKRAGELRIPVFVITQAGQRRSARRAWIEGFDDREAIFLVSFFEERAGLLMGADPADEGEFNAFDDQEAPLAPRPRRPGQQQFRFRVLRRYGMYCAVCPISVSQLLIAAHIIEKRDRGSDDPRNGLPLCANHHAAYDAGMFAIEPDTHALFVPDGYTAEGLSLIRTSLAHLRNLPHRQSLEWRWSRRRNPEEWSPAVPVE